MDRNTVGLVALVAFLFALAWIIASAVSTHSVAETPAVSSFAECEAAGNPVMESYPRQCASGGVTYMEDVSFNQYAGECVIAGCGGELCVPADEAGNIMTTCQYDPRNACYGEYASCDLIDGQCGWTVTQDFLSCVSDPARFFPEERLEVI